MQRSIFVRRMMYTAIAAGALLFLLNTVYISSSGLQFERTIEAGITKGFNQIVASAALFADSDFENARTGFTSAQADFEAVRADSWFVSGSQDPRFKTVDALTHAGLELSRAGEAFSATSNELALLPKLFFAANKKDSQTPLPSLTEKLFAQLPNIDAGLEHLKSARLALANIRSTLVPARHRERFEFANAALSDFVSTLENVRRDIPAIALLLGDHEPHTYLILLQNSAELRPTGGFIGNIIVIETNDGYVTKMDVEDVYHRDHQLIDIVTPPTEILPVNSRWFLRDSNYSGHFPLSAKKAAWFLEHASGPGVDTVIAIDESLIRDLLEVTGPLNIASLSKPITAANFSVVLSYIIESKLSGKENPKLILAEFLPAFRERLFAAAEPQSIAVLMHNATTSKYLQAFSFDDELQSFWSRHGMTGELAAPTSGADMLAIVRTSVSGNKSDQYIDEVVMHDTRVQADGSIIDELTIEKRHTWTNEIEKKIRSTVRAFGYRDISRNVLEILGRSRNIQWLRIYVPTGSTLLESSDPSVTMHTDGELGLTYFSAHMTTHVNDKTTLRLRYQLPGRLTFDPVNQYEFQFRKQAGFDTGRLVKRLSTEPPLTNYKNFPEPDFIGADGRVEYEKIVTEDATFKSVIGR